jgi:hypothetical protein
MRLFSVFAKDGPTSTSEVMIATFTTPEAASDLTKQLGGKVWRVVRWEAHKSEELMATSVSAVEEVKKP